MECSIYELTVLAGQFSLMGSALTKACSTFNNSLEIVLLSGYTSMLLTRKCAYSQFWHNFGKISVTHSLQVECYKIFSKRNAFASDRHCCTNDDLIACLVYGCESKNLK